MANDNHNITYSAHPSAARDRGDTRSTKSSCSRAERQLIDLMTKWQFGFIRNLRVKDGQPEFGSDTRLMRDVKLPNSPKSEPNSDEFHLRKHVVDLFDQLHAIGDGVVDLLEFRNGLPARLTIDAPLEDQ